MINSCDATDDDNDADDEGRCSWFLINVGERAHFTMISDAQVTASMPEIILTTCSRGLLLISKYVRANGKAHSAEETDEKSSFVSNANAQSAHNGWEQ